ncbi:MAG: DUF4406 domain-containing protein [Oxalobacteraceae bacterium]|jgi:hypothetical protein|nr:DUF4406 domain-containing protein [Oxalobacteraceae bacterium]MCE2830977.1 DUF4406 domain-containing protein [Oxalobacteraceae bacterium]
MRRVYIAGPMSGLPAYNWPLFNDTAARLRAQGYTVVNPTENGLRAEAPWEQHMRRDIAMLLTCDAILMLPGWSKSRGAMMEWKIAVELGFDVIYEAGE